MKLFAFIVILSIIYPEVQNTFQTGFPFFYYVQPQPQVYQIPPTHYTTTFNHNPFLTFPHHESVPQAPPVQDNYNAIPKDIHQEIHTPKFRGYTYQTRTSNGASSRVLFLTGPESQGIGSTFYSIFNEQSSQPNLARNFASNSLDPVSKSSDSESPDYFKNIYISPENNFVNNTNNVIRRIFQSQFSGAVNFYSTDSNISPQFVSNFPIPQFPTFPAVVPTNTDSLTANNDNSTDASDTVVTDSADDKSENEAQESVISNTRFGLNSIIQNYNSNVEITSTTSEPTTKEEEVSHETPTTEKLIYEIITKVRNIADTTTQNYIETTSQEVTSKTSQDTLTTSTPSDTTVVLSISTESTKETSTEESSSEEAVTENKSNEESISTSSSTLQSTLKTIEETSTASSTESSNTSSIQQITSESEVLTETTVSSKNTETDAATETTDKTATTPTTQKTEETTK